MKGNAAPPLSRAAVVHTSANGRNVHRDALTVTPFNQKRGNRLNVPLPGGEVENLHAPERASVCGANREKTLFKRTGPQKRRQKKRKGSECADINQKLLLTLLYYPFCQARRLNG